MTLRDTTIHANLPGKMTARTSLNGKSFVLPRVTWFHNEEEVAMNERVGMLQRTDGIVELIFAPALLPDEGVYRIEASYPTGIASSSSAYLTVESQ